MPELGISGGDGQSVLSSVEPCSLSVMAKRLTVEFDRARTAPRQARAALARFDHGLPDRRLCDAELLLSELVTNAVKYGDGSDVSVHFERDDGCFRTEVVDQGDGFITRLRNRADVYTPGGWGLPLVETLSDRWGAHQGSTHVWFELTL
jgi:anti-sigma regulatory factor (Ser/Thr protein kinase)